MDAVSLNARRSLILWVAGFREACCIHRVLTFCLRSKTLTIRTGQCFLLNGLIFLGSLFMFNTVVMPTLLWILPSECEQFGSEHICRSGKVLALYSFTRFVLVELFYVFWFYPLYGFSIILSTIWYNDIARHAFEVLRSKGFHLERGSSEEVLPENWNGVHSSGPGGFEGIQVVATMFIPYIGTAISFLLNAWMYAYYCFEYRWNLSKLSLEKRIEFFESNWAFFAGFGSPCVLAVFFFSRLVSYGVMAILFPLFVLTAAGSQAEQVIDLIRGACGGGPGKVPIFYAADTLSMFMLRVLTTARKDQ